MADGRAAAWRKRDERHRDREAAASATPPRSLLLIGVIVIDVLAFLLVPAVRPQRRRAGECVYPVCFINGNLELPAPARRLAGRPRAPQRGLIVLRRQHLVHDVHDVGRRGHRHRRCFWFLSRGTKLVPGGGQNVVEWVYETARELRHVARRPAAPSRTSRCSPRSSCSSCSATGAASSRPSARCDWFRAPTSRRQRHDRPRAGRVLLLPVPGLQAPGLRRLPRQVLPVRGVPERHRRRDHRPVRGAGGAPAGVREAGDAVDATLRQHLRRRGRPGRHDGADHRHHPSRRCSPSRSCSTSSRRSSSAR